MIEIIITRGEEDHLLVKGHAGGVYGKDIVCSAVSAIAQNLLIGLHDLNIEWNHFLDYGKMEISILKNWSADLEKALFILETTIKSFKEIDKVHPNKLRIMERRSEDII